MPNRSRGRKLRKKQRFIRKPKLRETRFICSFVSPIGERRLTQQGAMLVLDRLSMGKQIRIEKVNRLWNEWYSSIQRLPWSMYHPTANQFIEGYCRQTGQHSNKWVLIPTNKSVSVIVTVMNEKDTIPSILEQLHRLPLHEMIFVLNGSTDESFEIIRNQSWATIVHYHDPLGHDVGERLELSYRNRIFCYS